MGNQPNNNNRIQESFIKNESGVEHRISDGHTTTGVNLTASDLERLITRVIKASKEPDEETQKNIDKEKADRQKRMEQMLLEARQNEENVLRQQANCGHKKPDATPTIFGQIHSDGLIHPLCVRCQKLFTPYKPPMELISGMGIG